MPARFENKFNPTRRRLVLGVAGVLSFFGLGAGAALAAKASKASVGYRDTPKGIRIAPMHPVHFAERLQVGVWRRQRERLVPHLESVILSRE